MRGAPPGRATIAGETDPEEPDVPELNHGDLAIRSSAFDAHSPIPAEHAADGENVSPPVSWSGVPAGAKELVLIVHDPDAPLVDGFDHWVATGIDPTSAGLGRGATDGFRAGKNSLGELGWTGMAPPPGHGVHHYFFHLFAIDVELGGPSEPTRAEVLRAIEGHVVEQARIVGTYVNEG